MSQTKPLKRDLYLELQNWSLRLHIMKRDVAESERNFQAAVQRVFDMEGLDAEEWAVDLDQGLFVRKTSVSTDD